MSTYTTKVEVPVYTTEWVGVDHQFTVGDLLLHRPDGTGPYQPEEVVKLIQHGDTPNLKYVLKQVGRHQYITRSVQYVDSSYDLWLDHKDRPTLPPREG